MGNPESSSFVAPQISPVACCVHLNPIDLNCYNLLFQRPGDFNRNESRNMTHSSYSRRSSYCLLLLLLSSTFNLVIEASRLGHAIVIDKNRKKEQLPINQEFRPIKSNNARNQTSKASATPTVSIGVDVHGNSVDLPLVGAGTWQYNDTIAYESVCKAIQAGYTFIDTAYGYRNQKGVGKAIQDCWFGTTNEEGARRSREDLFVMTKIPGGLNTSEVWEAHQQNLKDLGLDYVDHLMTHFPADWEKTVASPKARKEEWLALEAIYKTGQTRSIGVSHYCNRHLDDILEVATVIPSINQVEYHVGSQDIDIVMQYCAKHDITFMSFSPLCGPCELEPQDSLVHGDLVTEIASHYSRAQATDNNDVGSGVITGSQVALRYIVQQGIPVIPKSNTLSHIESNLDIFDFDLSQEDMVMLAFASNPAAEGGDCDVP